MESLNQNIFRRQFALRNFRVKDVPISLFYRTQWSPNQKVFVTFRSFMLVQSLAWIVFYWITTSHYYYEELDNCCEALTLLYYILTFSLAVIGLTKHGKSTEPNAGLTVLKGATWVVHTGSLQMSLWSVILYWALVAPTETITTSIEQAYRVNKNALVFVFLFIDLCVVAFPVRLYHAIYSIPFYILYACVVLSKHWLGINSAVYDVMDFENNPTTAWIGLALLVFLSPFIAQFFYFCVFSLRNYIYEKNNTSQINPGEKMKASTVIMNEEVVGVPYDNEEAFELELQKKKEMEI